MKRIRLAALAAIALSATLYGCPEKKGPMEKAGESVDEAVNDAGRAIEDATD